LHIPKQSSIAIREVRDRRERERERESERKRGGDGGSGEGGDAFDRPTEELSLSRSRSLFFVVSNSAEREARTRFVSESKRSG